MCVLTSRGDLVIRQEGPLVLQGSAVFAVSDTMFESGDRLEVEIRGCSIWAVEVRISAFS